MIPAENPSCTFTKRFHHAVRFEALQKHDRSSLLMRFLEFLQNFETRMRTVLKLIADKRHMRFMCSQFPNFFLGTSDQGLDRETLFAFVPEGALQEFRCNVIRSDNKDRNTIIRY